MAPGFVLLLIGGALFPTEPGTRWLYDLDAAGAKGTLELTLVSRQVGGDGVEIRLQSVSKLDGAVVRGEETLIVCATGVRRASGSLGSFAPALPITVLGGRESWTGRLTREGVAIAAAATCSILGSRAITTKAGRFETTVAETTLDCGGTTITYRTWVANGVGIVRSETEFLAGKVLLNLVSFRLANGRVGRGLTPAAFSLTM